MGWQTKLRPGVLFDRIRSRAWVWGLFLLLAFLDQTWWGYRFGDTNQSFQVPILKSYFDSALYSGDLLMQTRSHYTTVYYFLLGLINQVVGNLELVFFAVHLLVIALLFGAIHRLARTTFKRPGVGLLAVLQMLPRRFDIQLGGGFLHRAFHTHTLAASPIVLFAISKFLDGKQTLAFFLLGLIFNINAQSVLFVFAMLALTSAIRWREYGLKTMARWLGVFVLAASPVLIWILTAAGEPLTQEWLRLLRIRSSHHSFPLTWPAAHWAIYGLFLSFGLIAWSLVRRGGENRSTHNAFGWFTVAFAVLCGMGLVFSAWVPVKLVLRANLFRSSAFMTVFVLIYGSNMVRTLWDGRNGEKALAVLIFLTLFFPAYRMWLVPLMLLLPIVLHRKIDWWAAIPGAAMVIVAARTPSVRFGALDLRPVRQLLGAFVDRPPLASLSVTLLGWLGLRKISARVRRPIVAILGVFLLGFGFYTVHRALNKPLNQGGDWVAVQLWAKMHTPKSALFLTPPGREGFRVHSERGIVAEWKDGTQQYFDDDFARKWWARVNEIGYYGGAYGRMGAMKIKTVARKYGATYALFRAQKRLSWPVAYRNRSFVVYRVPQ